MKKGLLFILLAAVSVCLPAQEKKMQQKSYRVKLTALVLIGLLVVALVHKCILATMMVKPISENVLLRHLTLL